MQFHVLRAVVGCETETDFDSVGDEVLGDPIRCPKCDDYYGMKRWLPPYRVRLRMYGWILGDMIFNVRNDILVSQSFITAWNERGLKGLEPLHPVEVVSMHPRSLHKNLQPYYRLDLQPTTPRVDFDRSFFISNEPECQFCGPTMVDAIIALRIDEDTWSGEDIFAPWGTIEVIVTQRVVDLARDHGLANVTTTPLEEFRRDPQRLYKSLPQA